MRAKLKEGNIRYMQTKLLSVIKMYVISILGGLLFYYFNLPLPWILGPMTTIILWKIVMKQQLSSPQVLRDTGFVILGIFFGLFFTIDTLHTVLPYFFPYLLSTILLVSISVINGIWLSKFIDLESMTSVIGTVPGGLSQMVAVADDLDANVAMVTILQTVRLLTVVFFVPFTVVQLFSGGPAEVLSMTSTSENASIFHYLWFVFPALTGWSIHHFFPAAYVIGPLVATAFMNIIGISLPNIPFLVMVWGQITVGMYMGNSISLSDLKKGGKYGVIYAFVTIFLVVVSFGLGYLLTLVTTLSLQTAMLSVAPGGIVEMTLTATAVGADASVVSSLQLIRVLFIILLVPLFLKWGFTGKKRPLMKTNE